MNVTWRGRQVGPSHLRKLLAAMVAAALTAVRRLAPRALPAAAAACAGSYLLSSTSLEAAPPAPGLDPSKFVPLTLTKKTAISSNTAIYRFAYANAEADSGMTVASCLVTKAPIGSEKPDGTRANVIRPCTRVALRSRSC